MKLVSKQLWNGIGAIVYMWLHNSFYICSNEHCYKPSISKDHNHQSKGATVIPICKAVVYGRIFKTQMFNLHHVHSSNAYLPLVVNPKF